MIYLKINILCNEATHRVQRKRPFSRSSPIAHERHAPATRAGYLYERRYKNGAVRLAGVTRGSGGKIEQKSWKERESEPTRNVRSPERRSNGRPTFDDEKRIYTGSARPKVFSLQHYFQLSTTTEDHEETEAGGDISPVSAPVNDESRLPYSSGRQAWQTTRTERRDLRTNGRQPPNSIPRRPEARATRELRPFGSVITTGAPVRWTAFTEKTNQRAPVSAR